MMEFLKFMRFGSLILAAVLLIASCGMQEQEHEYAECYKADCKILEKISKEGIDSIDGNWLMECLYQYHVQPDGHGLAMMLHPVGCDASGTTPTVLYETSDGGRNWNVLHERFDISRGKEVLVYMGEIAVLAADCSKGGGGELMISYDRGRTWSERMSLVRLLDYDTSQYDSVEPYVINYNEYTGLITFGWKEGWNRESEYILINQFDANTCQFVEEVYRSPDFPRAS